MSLESIPTDIQAKILKRLPVKSLIQFRSVSKPWKGLIDSPNFIVSYGVRHPQPDCFIFRYEIYPNLDTYLSLVDNENDSLVQQKFIPTVRHPTSVVGSSHGLLCFNKRKCGISGALTETVVLWNPPIRKSVGIQVPNMYDSLNDISHSFWEDNIIGFGVCPVTFDPTILKIQCIDYKRKMKDVPGISLPWKVRVFTLSTGTWSILSTNLPLKSIRLRGSQVVIERFTYWVAFEMLEAENGTSHLHFLIMSFDLTAKEFKEISLPDSLTNPLCSIKSISKLHESLVLFEYHREFEEDVPVCCLWMMNEEGVGRSFTKLFNINVPHATVKTLLGFRKTGEIILETQINLQRYFAELKVYDPNTEAIDNLGIDGNEYSFFSVLIWNHCF